MIKEENFQSHSGTPGCDRWSKSLTEWWVLSEAVVHGRTFEWHLSWKNSDCSPSSRSSEPLITLIQLAIISLVSLCLVSNFNMLTTLLKIKLMHFFVLLLQCCHFAVENHNNKGLTNKSVSRIYQYVHALPACCVDTLSRLPRLTNLYSMQITALPVKQKTTQCFNWMLVTSLFQLYSETNAGKCNAAGFKKCIRLGGCLAQASLWCMFRKKTGICSSYM